MMFRVTNKSGVAWMCSFREGGIYSRGALALSHLALSCTDITWGQLLP